MTPPNFFYGTAWKEERTAELTLQALQSGYTAIDTANQRKHYNEEGVGEGLKQFFLTSRKQRKDVFLQTKFTYQRGQDHRLPYNPNDPLDKQVEDSFRSSLQHLGTDYIDSYVLHGPYGPGSIVRQDLECWQAMELLWQAKKVHAIGISNINADQLTELCRQVKVRPAYVQNRCYARLMWDQEVREICRSEGIRYQGFSLLTANQSELESPLIRQLAAKYGKIPAQIIFKFSQQIGMICLTGTTSPDHMKIDLAINDFELTATEIEQVEAVHFN